MDVLVTEGQRPVDGLGKDDFIVYDEGVPQNVVHFGGEAEPIWLALLLDVSGSMTAILHEIAAVAGKALDLLGPQDQVAVMAFGRESHLIQEFTPSRTLAAEAIRRCLRPGTLAAGSSTHAAVMEAARYVGDKASGKPGRRVVVILTDNEGLNYQASAGQAIEALGAAGTVLSAIVTSRAMPPPPPKPGAPLNPDFTPSDVFLLARESGGEVLRADRAAERFREMLERARMRYALHYALPPAEPGSTRRIGVELSPAARRRHPRVEIRARKAYRVPAE